MPQPFFQFKQFTVWHDKCAMKVGTDGVLLGAWAPIESTKSILDIGTGTGLVALMLAQRSNASVVALEINVAAAEQARENIARSPWQERIEVVNKDFKQFVSGRKFDAIVSNPPYFVDSLNCPDKQRNSARHNGDLTYDDLLKGVSNILSSDGLFTPTDVEKQVKETALAYTMYPVRQLYVMTKPGAAPKRTLISFSFHHKKCVTEQLLTEIARHQYSEEYIRLTQEFYLNL